MKTLLRSGCWSAAIAAALLFVGTADLHAQFRTTTGTAPAATAAKTTATTNANLFRANLTAPARQPMPTRTNTMMTPYGMNGGQMQQGAYPYGMNQGMYPGMSQGMYPGMNQGYYPGMNQGYYPGMNQGYYPGMNQGNGVFRGF